MWSMLVDSQNYVWLFKCPLLYYYSCVVIVKSVVCRLLLYVQQ